MGALGLTERTLLIPTKTDYYTGRTYFYGTSWTHMEQVMVRQWSRTLSEFVHLALDVRGLSLESATAWGNRSRAHDAVPTIPTART